MKIESSCQKGRIVSFILIGLNISSSIVSNIGFHGHLEIQVISFNHKGKKLEWLG